MNDIITCDYCDKPATYNVQSAIITWSITKGEYSQEPIDVRPDDELNDHFCDEHYSNN